MKNYIFHVPELVIISLVLFLIAHITDRKHIKYVAIGFVLFLLFFFRGWINNVGKINDNTLYSPCEGKIIHLSLVGKTIHISIFLNVHNIHIQYMPITGLIEKVTHKKGTFHPAYLFKKSRYNERMKTVISNKYGKFKFFQIAGLLARRIKVFHKENTMVKALNPLGLIKFGSRCDIIFPAKNFKLNKNLKIGSLINIGDVIGNYLS